MKRILVAPLDWGLGHATRCIPIIRELLLQKSEVFIAGSGRSLALLKKEFPLVQCFDLPAYDPQYPLSGSMVWEMLKQLPHFIKVIKSEHVLLESIIIESKI